MSFDPFAGATHENFDLVGYSDQGGRPAGGQVMVSDGYAYIGHYDGVIVLDVRDPRDIRPANFVSHGFGEMTWSGHLQTYGDLLMSIEELNFYRAWGLDHAYYLGSIPDVHHSMFGEPGVDFSAGMRIYDIADRANPRPIGFWAIEQGCGIHRIWYDGGKYAYVSAFLDGYVDHILVVVDVSDPTKPFEAGRWWLPGMWKDGGEEQTWSNRVALHHAVVKDDVAYGGWRDGGMTILDVHDPSDIKLISHTNWCPPFGGGTHNCLALHDRDLVIVTDESILDNCEDQVKYTWVFDIREPTRPVSISTLPTPNEQDFCNVPGHFGPHNLHENREGSWQDTSTVFVTYQNAGLRVFDISNPYEPKQTAFFIPPPPQRMVAILREDRVPFVHTGDVFATTEGLCYITDYNCGLYVLQYKG